MLLLSTFGLIHTRDVSLGFFEKHLYVPRAVDLLIRTSGEVRLSDFMLWQAVDALLYFAKPLWPELSFFEFCTAIFTYQLQRYRLPRNWTAANQDSSSLVLEEPIR